MKTKIVYLLHFHTPLVKIQNGKPVKVQHYLGSAIDLRKRLNAHWTGHGTPLTKAFVNRGIPFILAITWRGDRKVERRLKNLHNSKHLCPYCRG